MKSERPIKVLQVLGGMSRGGVETLLMQLLRSIDRNRYRIDILSHTEQPCPYDDEVKALGSRLIPCMGHPNPWVYAKNFRRAVRENGPYDVIHAHQFYFNAMIMYLAALEQIPIRIAYIHPFLDVKDMGSTSLVRGLYRRTAAMLIYRHATQIVAASRSSLEHFRRTGHGYRREESVIFSGIDLDPFARHVDKDEVRRRLHLPVDRPVICYVARFSPHKNHEQVLRVADLLERRGRRLHFALAGTHGTRLTALKTAVHGRSDVSLNIGLEDVSELLMASDLFFFPSLEEGFGMVAAEAAAAGLPIVATDLPTLREACPPGHHRFMHCPNDDIAAAAHIETILDDAELRQTLAEEARCWVQRYSFRNTLEGIVSLYRRTA